VAVDDGGKKQLKTLLKDLFGELTLEADVKAMIC
jgi:hypothetical protein